MVGEDDNDNFFEQFRILSEAKAARNSQLLTIQSILITGSLASVALLSDNVQYPKIIPIVFFISAGLIGVALYMHMVVGMMDGVTNSILRTMYPDHRMKYVREFWLTWRGEKYGKWKQTRTWIWRTLLSSLTVVYFELGVYFLVTVK